MLESLVALSNYSYAYSAWPPVIVGTCIAVLAVVVLSRERLSRVSVAFGGLCFSSALWLLSFGGIYSATDSQVALAWSRCETVAVCFIPSTLFLFSLMMVRSYHQYRYWVRTVFLISTVFAISAVCTSKFITGLYDFPWGPYPRYGPLGTLFLIFFFTLCLISLFFYWKTFRTVHAESGRHQLKTFFIAFAIALLGTVDFLASYGISAYPIGYLPVYSGLLLLAQIIWRYRFADITPAFAASQIMSTMPSAIVVLDANGIICLVNEAACVLMQRKEKDLVGSSIQSITQSKVPPADFQQLLHEGSLRDYEIMLPDSSRDIRYVSVSASVMRDALGQPLAYICVARDVTASKKADQALRESELRFRLLVEGVKDYAIVFLDLAGHVVSWNEGVERIHGYKTEEIVGRHFACLYPEEEVLRGTPQRGLNVAIAEGRMEDEGWRIRKDGSRFWADVIITALKGKNGELQGFAKITRDITERKHVEEALRVSESRFRRLVDSNIIGFIMVDPKGRVLEANDAFLKLLGYDREDLAAGRVGGEMMTPPEYRHVDQWMQEKLKITGVCPPVEKEYVCKDGSRAPVLVGVVMLENFSKNCLCFVIDASERRAAQEGLIKAYDELEVRVQERTRELQHEIEKREKAEEALRNQAVTDTLTGLYNRRGFIMLAEQHLQLARRRRKGFLLFMADLDNLKPINDTFGHAEGDHALIQAKTFLKQTFRESDIVARIGGDEFAVVVIEDPKNNEAALSARLQQKLDDYNRSSGRHYNLGLSMGSVRVEPDDAFTLEQLMLRADGALYEQKKTKVSRKSFHPIIDKEIH